MQSKTKTIIAFGIAAIVALKLFIFGLSYPLEYRVRGDAYTYLVIASQFTDFSSILTFTGDRTVGVPLFDFIIGKSIAFLTSSNTLQVLTWANAIGIALLTIHFVSAWLFSGWAKKANLIQSENTRLVLFVLFATYPALIGHTTSPLSDTLAVDLVVLGLVSMHSAINSEVRYQGFLYCSASAFLFGFAILVRPGNLAGVVAALAAGTALAFFSRYRKAALTCGAVAIGCVLVLAPYYSNCSQKYGTLCLQSPRTFDFVSSAQVGLRGARILWQKSHLLPGKNPILPDDMMFSNYYQRCQLKRIVGIDVSSLTGCLITNPLALPAYMVKKWIGLFDHYRFTPYLEEATPYWLRWLSRGYDSLVWLGFALFLLLPIQATKRNYRIEIREKLVAPVTPMLLVVYSMVLLAQHTALHTEDRYGFPLIPLCVIMLMIYGEKHIQSGSIVQYRKVIGLSLYCIAAVAGFIVQVIGWDNAAFY